MENIQTSEKPVFNEKIEKEILNFKTGEKYKLLSGQDMVFSKEDIEQITSICSQEEVYNILFKIRFKDRPYTTEDATQFTQWVEKGWNDRTHFVFFVRNNENKIIGAVDIKSPDLNRAEVGYWTDKDSSGFMTNALIELCSIAKDAKYKKLFGEVRPENPKSSAVLERAGFEYVGVNKREYNKDTDYLVYEKNLVK